MIGVGQAFTQIIQGQRTGVADQQGFGLQMGDQVGV